MKIAALLFVLVCLVSPANAATFTKATDYKNGEGWVYYYDVTVKGKHDHLSILVYKCNDKKKIDCAIDHSRQLADRKAKAFEKDANGGKK